MLEKILEEITAHRNFAIANRNHNVASAFELCINIIRKHMNDGWIPCDVRLPEDRRANYEVTFINECGYEEHGFAQWYDRDFHIPAVVIAWREHLEPYHPEKGAEE
nr:MAG TPA: hypothetical protein [Bacteriophage sp.]